MVRTSRSSRITRVVRSKSRLGFGTGVYSGSCLIAIPRAAPQYSNLEKPLRNDSRTLHVEPAQCVPRNEWSTIARNHLPRIEGIGGEGVAVGRFCVAVSSPVVMRACNRWQGGTRKKKIERCWRWVRARARFRREMRWGNALYSQQSFPPSLHVYSSRPLLLCYSPGLSAHSFHSVSVFFSIEGTTPVVCFCL